MSTAQASSASKRHLHPLTLIDPEEIPARFKINFLIDFIKLYIDPSGMDEPNTSKRKKRIRAALGHNVTRIVSKRSHPRLLKVTVHDPKNLEFIISTLAQLKIFKVWIIGIEVTADFCPRIAADRALIPEVCTILAHGIKTDFGLERIYEVASGRNIYNPTVKEARKHFKLGSTFWAGHKHDVKFCRIYPKCTDQKAALPEEEHRARYEVNYTTLDNPIPLHEFNIKELIGKNDFLFRRKSSPVNATMEALFQNAPLMEGVPLLPKGVLGRKPGVKLVNAGQSRRKYASSTEANKSLNKAISNQARTLHKHWSVHEFAPDVLAPFSTMGACPVLPRAPKQPAQKFTQTSSPSLSEKEDLSITSKVNTPTSTPPNTSSPAHQQPSTHQTSSPAQRRDSACAAGMPRWLLMGRDKDLEEGPDRSELAIARSLSTGSMTSPGQQSCSTAGGKVLEKIKSFEEHGEKFFPFLEKNIGHEDSSLLLGEKQQRIESKSIWVAERWTDRLMQARPSSSSNSLPTPTLYKTSPQTALGAIFISKTTPRGQPPPKGACRAS